jgi:hypothetical protein
VTAALATGIDVPTGIGPGTVVALTVRMVGCVVDAPWTVPPAQYSPGWRVSETVSSYGPGVPPVATVPALPVPVEIDPASSTAAPVGSPVPSSA